MEIMAGFLNLFLVPLLSVSIWSRRHGETVTVSGQWIVRWAVFTVCSFPLTHGIIRLVRRLLHREIAGGSALYTVIAICVAILLPYLCDLFNTVFSHVSFRVESRKEPGPKEEDSGLNQEKSPG
jgi:hypothetical protein